MFNPQPKTTASDQTPFRALFSPSQIQASFGFLVVLCGNPDVCCPMVMGPVEHVSGPRPAPAAPAHDPQGDGKRPDEASLTELDGRGWLSRSNRCLPPRSSCKRRGPWAVGRREGHLNTARVRIDFKVDCIAQRLVCPQ